MSQRTLFQQPVRCLSLHNPWAVLMAIGAKGTETRGWKTDYRGPLAIHASKTWEKDEIELCTFQPFAKALVDAGFTTPRQVIETGGKILCVVDLYAIEQMTDEVIEKQRLTRADEIAFGAWAPKRYAWRTRNVRRLDPPVEFRGLQGLFSLPLELTNSWS